MRIPTRELLEKDKVLLKDQWWIVEAIDGARVTVTDGIRRATTDKVDEWEVESRRHNMILEMSDLVVDMPPEPVTNLITTQDYLKAVGMPDDELESNARTFGTVLMKLYRARHGKDARPAKKLEYVHYLDVNGMEAQAPNDQAPRHLRVRANGWYESNAFEESDLDLMEEVRKQRHPGLDSLHEAISRAMLALREIGAEEAKAIDDDSVNHVKLIWLAEKTVQECLASGVVCGHTECARRRSKQARSNRNLNDEMDWS